MIIPIRADSLPATAELLREQIEAGLRGLSLLPRSVQVTAPSWPAVQELMVDLSGTSVDSLELFPRLAGAGEGALAVEHLLLEARPLTLRALPLTIAIEARAASLRMTQLTGGQHALVLQKAANGHVELSARIADLERLAHTLLAEQARKHGADIVSTRLVFTQRGPRSLSFQGDIVAKVMMMKAPLSIAGDLDLDDTLQLRISNLRLTGGGMAANLARGFLQPQFEKIEQKPISLGALALGEVRLRDVDVTLDGDILRIGAKFGS